MDDRTAARHLAGAELWVRAPDDRRHPTRPPAFVAGWEDGEPFCATVCSTDVGLAFCRRCPEEIVSRTLRTGRPSQGTCDAGVRMLAFPAPRGSRTSVAVLRVGPPTPRRAATVSERTRVVPEALRRAARRAAAPDARGALAAARLLRTADGLLRWEAQQRSRGADRRRTATAALAQMIATSEEFHELYRASKRQRLEIERNQRRLDRLARETLRASDQERARIAHQIHDTAAQSMVSAFRFLEAARAAGAAAGGGVDDQGPFGSGSPGGGTMSGGSAVSGGSGGTGAAASGTGGGRAPGGGAASPSSASSVSSVGGGAAASGSTTPGSAADRSTGYLEAASDRLVTAIREVRDVLAHLLPPGLEELGLAHAIQRRMQGLASESGLSVELTGDLPRLEPWVEQALYGMTAEAMTNAVRHARAAHLQVALGEMKGRAVITIQDDGQGFDPKKTAPRAAGRGLGLLGIARQTSWLGGRATVRSRPGAGTTVRISLPLARHRAAASRAAPEPPVRGGDPPAPTPRPRRARTSGTLATDGVR